MIVPPSVLPSASPGGLTQDNTQKPSPALLLMAAAEMHRMGRLRGKAASKGKMPTPPDDGEAA